MSDHEPGPRRERAPRTGRAVGMVTRGTTGVNRLRRVDRWVIHARCSYLRTVDSPLCVDLGYGREPWTTAQWRETMRTHVREDIEVLGIEIDRDRVAAAQAQAAPGLSFAHGGFEVPTGGRPVHVLRAMNVLRQYDESAVVDAWTLMAAALAPDGVLIDGTCDEVGRLGTWLAVCRDIHGRPQPQSLTLSAQVATLEQPSRFATRLPKSLIHHHVPGTALHRLLADFDRAWASHAGLAVFSPRQRFIAAARQLRDWGWPVADNEQRWRLGEVTVDYGCLLD
ncbi:MAG: hypothetical protein KGP01_03070 [Actinomycetales bacterium]|nr:hypothetical protein [Actinomycetales bacterium]